MTEKKKVSKTAQTGVKTTKEERKANAMPKRILAFVFWIAAIVVEVVLCMLLSKVLYWQLYLNNQMVVLIGGIVADLVLCIIGSQIWKGANAIDPASSKDKVKFFLQNQMGLIMSVLAFAPLIIVLLSNKDLDKKTKRIVTAAAVAALLVAGLLGIDFNAPSQEERDAIEGGYDISEEIYWTRYGRSYHTTKDCQALSRTTENNLFSGSIVDALDAGRYDPCDFCVPQE